MKIGVLALQGNFKMHCKILENIGVSAVEIRYPIDLDSVEGLVIPGGESTTMSKIMHMTKFHEPIIDFAQDHSVLGTCAGLILMSGKVVDSEIESLGLLDIQVQRNGYGRQIYSDTVLINYELSEQNYSIPASFIRAPKVIQYGESVQVIAKYEDFPVIVKQGKHVGISFHPELDNISIFHEHIFFKR